MKKLGNLRRIKYLMLFSQLLLLVFMGYWLYTQYNSTRSDFHKTLLAQFEESQRKISDSLLMTEIFHDEKSGASQVTTIDIRSGDSTSLAGGMVPNHNFDVIRTREIKRPGGPVPGEVYTLHGKADQWGEQLPIRKDVNVSVIIGRIKAFADSNETLLFQRDTIMLNEAFRKKMEENGWGFKIKWLDASRHTMAGKKAIFIKSNYFTDSYGLEVSHFSWYLLKKITPQILFTIVLLLITGFAFRLAYRNLKEQTMLAGIKNDLISNMSHELKTPVSTIKVALEALDTYDVLADREKAKEYLSMANMEMKRLDLLIGQALNTSLLEEGKMVLHKEPTDLNQLVTEVLDVMKIRFAQQHAQVAYTHDGGGALVQADRLHIQGVLMNILDNALKYAGAGTAISVKLSTAGENVTISIADNGPGIPAPYLEKIFDKFFRVPTGNEHSIKGYGLGLSYAAQVMQQHGGTIKAANRPEGGAVFTITFKRETV